MFQLYYMLITSSTAEGRRKNINIWSNMQLEQARKLQAMLVQNYAHWLTDWLAHGGEV